MGREVDEGEGWYEQFGFRYGGWVKSKGWVPQQHGAWAMMIVPFFLGLIEATRNDAVGWGHATLFPFWMLGYFTFNAASGWLKAAPRQKSKYVRPLVIYATLSALFGVATLLIVGFRPLAWVLVFLPLVAPALWLAGQRKERATIGGLITVAAASLMVPVSRYLNPSSPADWSEIAAMTAVVFGYFFGTVLFVKTNIRERGHRGYLVVSIAHHALLLLATTVLSMAGLVAWWWVPIMLFVLVRTIAVPPMKLKPMPLGMIEVGVCTAILLCALLIG